MPIHLMGTRVDPHAKGERLDVVFLLPSGSNDRIDEISFIVGGGWVLQLEMPYSTPFMNTASPENIAR